MMFTKYRNVSLSTKLLILGSALILAAAICLRFDYNIVATLLTISGVSLGFHIIASRPKTTLSLIVCFLQAVSLSYASYVLGYVFASIGLDQVLFTIVIGAVLATASIVISYIAFRFSKIKVWLNLALSFVVLDLSGFVVGSYLGTDFIVCLLISSAAGLLVALLFSSSLFKKQTHETVLSIREGLRNPTAKKTAIEIFKKNDWEFEENEDYKNVFLVKGSDFTSIVFAVHFNDQLSKSKKDVHYKGISLGNFFNDLVVEARRISLDKKMSKKNLSVIIMDTSNKYSLPARKFEEVQIIARNDSRDSKDKLIVSNNQGIVNYIKTVKV